MMGIYCGVSWWRLRSFFESTLIGWVGVRIACLNEIFEYTYVKLLFLCYVLWNQLFLRYEVSRLRLSRWFDHRLWRCKYSSKHEVFMKQKQPIDCHIFWSICFLSEGKSTVRRRMFRLRLMGLVHRTMHLLPMNMHDTTSK